MLILLLVIALAVTGGSGSGGSIMEHLGRVEVVAQEGSVAVMPCTAPSAASRSWRRSPHHAHSFQWTKSTDQSTERTERTVCRREKSGLMYRGAGAGLSKHITCGVDYSLRLRNVSKADAGEYACSLANRGRTIITLRVIRVSFSNPEVTEGERLTVSCHITPTPPRWPMVSWKLNGEDYATWSHYPKNVTVAKVSQSHRGNWTCLVQTSSSFPTAEATQVLKVKGIESPLVDGALVYAGVGSSATLPCVFTQGLAPNVTWTKFSNQGLSSISSPSSGPSSPSLPRSFVPQSLSSSSITPWDKSWVLEGVEVGDAGSYRCSGAVEGRLVERKMELVTAQVVSSPSSKKNSGLTLTCQLSNDREVTRYEWLRVTYDNASVATVISVGEARTLRFPVVTTDDIGEWVCRYHGKNGLLGNVTYHLHLMGGLKAGEVEGQSPTSGALVIGLSLLLMLVLLIALQMYRNHRRRQMTLAYPAMENIIHSLANQREEKERRQMNKKKKSGPMEEEV